MNVYVKNGEYKFLYLVVRDVSSYTSQILFLYVQCVCTCVYVNIHAYTRMHI